MNTSSTEKSFNKILLLATIAGMRSMMAPALLSMNLSSDQKLKLKDLGFDFLTREGTQATFAALTTAELVGDKLPFTPSRLKSPLLTGRLMSGASVGALSFTLDGRSGGEGAALGAMVSLFSSVFFFGVRKLLTVTKIVPATMAGLAEDALAFYLAGKYLEAAKSDDSSPRLLTA